MTNRKDTLIGTTRRIKTGCGNIYVTINVDENNNPIEVFAQLGKAGGCAKAQTEVMGRLITIGLQSGVKIETLVRHLEGIACQSISYSEGTKINSCSDAIAIALKKFMENKNEKKPI